MRDIRQYQQFDAEDYADDPAFRRWVLRTGSSEQNDRFWEELVQGLPHRASEIERAKTLLLDLNERVEEYRLTDSEIEAHLQPLREAALARARGHRQRGRRRWLGVAAAVLLTLSAGLALFALFSNPGEQVYYAGRGERLEVPLPDGSTVLLNARSRLRVPGGDWSTREREVWLEGEAFFRINRTPAGGERTFRVHTPDEATSVEVLGTEFNLRARPTITEVVLTEGRVALHTPAGDAIMEPGELVEYVYGSDDLQSRKVEPDRYLGWMDGLLQFDSEPLYRITREIEALTGAEIVIARAALRDIELSVSVPTDDPEEFFEILRTIEGDRLRVVRTKKGYRIE